jgi:hypothetical protein
MASLNVANWQEIKTTESAFHQRRSVASPCHPIPTWEDDLFVRLPWVFGKKKVTMFEMNKYLAQHLTSPEAG